MLHSEMCIRDRYALSHRVDRLSGQQHRKGHVLPDAGRYAIQRAGGRKRNPVCLLQMCIRDRGRSARAYGRYQNVFLTDEEMADLQASFPTVWGQYIEKLSEYMASTGKRYQSHAATIRRLSLIHISRWRLRMELQKYLGFLELMKKSRCLKQPEHIVIQLHALKVETISALNVKISLEAVN